MTTSVPDLRKRTPFILPVPAETVDRLLLNAAPCRIVVPPLMLTDGAYTSIVVMFQTLTVPPLTFKATPLPFIQPPQPSVLMTLTPPGPVPVTRISSKLPSAAMLIATACAEPSKVCAAQAP